MSGKVRNLTLLAGHNGFAQYSRQPLARLLPIGYVIWVEASLIVPRLNLSGI